MTNKFMILFPFENKTQKPNSIEKNEFCTINNKVKEGIKGF